MKILVLGAGVIGVTTAYGLGRAGHEVVVLDKADGVATQTSRANGAQLAYSYAEPFASPAMAVLAAELPNVTIGNTPSGKLILTRTREELDSFGALAEIKQSYGLPVEMLDKQACTARWG